MRYDSIEEICTTLTPYEMSQRILDLEKSLSEPGNTLLTIKEYEQKAIISALLQTNGNRNEAAKLIRMPIRTFQRKLSSIKKAQAIKKEKK